MFGRTVRIRSPNAAAKLGIAYVTEDRKAQGLLPNRSVRENATIANLRRFARWGILRLATEARYARDMVKRLDVRLASQNVEIRTLSGGNQQKVLIGRALAIEPRIILLDEPTRGVDIGAKQEIYAAIERLVADGMAVMLISSDLEEVLRLSDQIVVLRRGRIAATLSRAEASETAIMRAAALARLDPASRRGATAIARTWQRLGVLAALILLVIAASFLSHRFLTVPNLMNVLRQVSIVGILAIGMTFVMLARGIDLSVGSILGVAVVLFAARWIPGDARGHSAWNGRGSAGGSRQWRRRRLWGAATLHHDAWHAVLRAWARLHLYRRDADTDQQRELYAFGNGYFAGVPIPSLILIATLIVSGFVRQLTPFGRSIYAIGSNEEAARLSGVPVKAYTTLVYVISGSLAGLAGLVYASQLSIGTYRRPGLRIGRHRGFVVGGTSLFGGKGSWPAPSSAR